MTTELIGIGVLIGLVAIALFLEVNYTLRARLLGWKPGSIEKAKIEYGEDYEIRHFQSRIKIGFGVFYRKKKK